MMDHARVKAEDCTCLKAQWSACLCGVTQVFARDQIEHITAQAWLSENKQLEPKVAKLSLHTGFMSEYTRMIILEDDHLKKVKESTGTKVSKKSHPRYEANIQGAEEGVLHQAL